MTDTQSGEAVLAEGAIIIRLDLSALPQVIEGAWVINNLDTRFKIIDVMAFAKDLVRELNREEEDGSTRIHHMFDAAIAEAINQGADGIEEHEDQDV